jgi:threonine/homoserine/homoserine lactone efflux protein
MPDTHLLAFLGLAAVLTITPGADMALVARQVWTRGRSAALGTTLGIAGGCVVHAVASAFGLSVLLQQSATTFEGVKLAGAAYLAFLGMQACREALRSKGDHTERPTRSAARCEGGRARSVAPGFFTNLLNPKVALFYLAVLPQFVPAGAPLLAWSLGLAAIHIVMGVLWLVVYALLLERLAAVFRSRRVTRVVHALTGLALLGLGTRLALERR